MPNKKAAIKDLKKSKKRSVRNSLIKRNIKEIIKKGQKAVTEGKPVGDLSKQLQKAVDKAIKNKILKPNAGNRKKSRFAKMIKRGPVTEKSKNKAKTE
ncbi:MAG: hypothetical protein A2406_03350 [Candidatus Komeilibacteria bacterium RIFOXYC1_FULL_37_11]|uniref:Small ribosomal subunit protein bS20 n=1 Tax=Candidatus Komeilibacteria bacterium RIFOXYC1_FULL_37_11 TaxID=1798555 RepID=A0A1G2BZ35_9BACT|nr:MAG: hypothetical protein A2406_03350 [Candidatus Komeilibacteria bacterium RIFOXYC1_FULL_37_11]OGY95148.1 MAG: hypothetical protein A2611_00340 [Candidatus Komeilibacteria bacterium RIFOXYD1_FULL_37_29]OGY96573.1 MAG: hypothetical protein A2543_01475 [Candidatus Komeilibacteria bacterium RIFOXYD2_FULL_37_8]